MRIGDLRERVAVLKKSPVADSQGGRAVTWVDLVTDSATSLTRLSAAIVFAGGTSERVGTGALQAMADATVTMRYRADVTAQMRLSWRPFRAAADRVLQIHSVVPSEDRAWLTLACSEVQG